MKKLIKNSKGSMLLQLMGLSVAITAGSMYLFNNVNQSKKFRNLASANLLIEDIVYQAQLELMNPDACLNSFGGVDLSVAGNTSFTDLKTSGNDSSMIRIGQYGTGARVISLDSINFSTSRIVTLNFSKNSNTTSGVVNLQRQFAINVAWNSASPNEVEKCMFDDSSSTLRSLSDSICSSLGGTYSHSLLRCHRPSNTGESVVLDWVNETKRSFCTEILHGNWNTTSSRCEYEHSLSADQSYIKNFFVGLDSNGDVVQCQADCNNAKYRCTDDPNETIAPLSSTCPSSAVTCQVEHLGTNNCPYDACSLDGDTQTISGVVYKRCVHPDGTNMANCAQSGVTNYVACGTTSTGANCTVTSPYSFGSNCSGTPTVTTMTSGSSQTVTNTMSGFTGQTTLSCTDGVLTASGTTCEPETTAFDCQGMESNFYWSAECYNCVFNYALNTASTTTFVGACTYNPGFGGSLNITPSDITVRCDSPGNITVLNVQCEAGSF